LRSLRSKIKAKAGIGFTKMRKPFATENTFIKKYLNNKPPRFLVVCCVNSGYFNYSLMNFLVTFLSPDRISKKYIPLESGSIFKAFVFCVCTSIILPDKSLMVI
jgi:hypothetical protein